VIIDFVLPTKEIFLEANRWNQAVMQFLHSCVIAQKSNWNSKSLCHRHTSLDAWDQVKDRLAMSR
jgi:hypothetical protein